MKEMIAKVGDSINKDGIASVCLTGEELVRCRDCKHFEPDGIYTMCYRHNGLSQNADWFCADGERKDE